MQDKYVKAIKDELKAKIKLGRLYKSVEIQEFTNGLERALAIIEKYERKDKKNSADSSQKFELFNNSNAHSYTDPDYGHD